jgi:hypothetical protein
MGETSSPLKADGLHFPEGSSLMSVNGEFMRHHRGLRPDHVLKGVTWELGRARYLHVMNTGKQGQTG